MPRPGCTVHEVTAELDGGPILGQARVPVLPGDTPETLAARVLEQEHRLYPMVLGGLPTGTGGGSISENGKVRRRRTLQGSGRCAFRRTFARHNSDLTFAATASAVMPKCL